MSQRNTEPATAALDLLFNLVDERIKPDAALARIPPLRRRYPDAEINLLWDRDAFSGDVHYDALVTSSGETISLSVCPDNGLPWPLRGVQRWSEAELVRVNQTTLTVADAMELLDFIWDEDHILLRLVDACLLRAAIESYNIEPSAEELQQAMDAFRQRHGLLTRAETEAWMNRQGLTHERLEYLIADQASLALLKDRVTSGQIEAHFHDHRADFDTAVIAEAKLGDETAARSICEMVRVSQVQLFDVLASWLAEDPAARAPDLEGPALAVVRRGDVPSPAAAAAFEAQPGELVGPFRAQSRYAIAQVISHAQACLDEDTRLAVREALFRRWLDERRCAASVQWNWGREPAIEVG